MHQKVAGHLFVVCQAGAEKALKAELARDYPEYKFGFSRPGFVTFKAAEPLGADFELRSIFARAYGLSLGSASAKKGDDVIAKLAEAARALAEETGAGKLRLHVFERDFHEPGSEPEGFVHGAVAAEMEKKLRTRASGLFESKSLALRDGEMVFDVIVVDEGEAWFGAHAHTARHHRWPGGWPEIPFPKDAPSRAYLKLEEAILWSGAPIQAGDTAVEIGSAPGGASYALLKRGVDVVGIDPAGMDLKVLNFRENSARFRHIARPVAQVPREELPESVEWVLLDMNVEPRISLFAADRLIGRMTDSLLGIILTIKLNQWKIADEIPQMLEHVKAMGMIRVRATQLAHNRQEFCLYGLTRKGAQRLQSST